MQARSRGQQRSVSQASGCTPDHRSTLLQGKRKVARPHPDPNTAHRCTQCITAATHRWWWLESRRHLGALSHRDHCQLLQLELLSRCQLRQTRRVLCGIWKSRFHAGTMPAPGGVHASTRTGGNAEHCKQSAMLQSTELKSTRTFVVHPCTVAEQLEDIQAS